MTDEHVNISVEQDNLNKTKSTAEFYVDGCADPMKGQQQQIRSNKNQEDAEKEENSPFAMSRSDISADCASIDTTAANSRNTTTTGEGEDDVESLPPTETESGETATAGSVETARHESNVIDIWPVAAEDMSLIDALLLPFHPVSPPSLDTSRGVAVVTLPSVAVARTIICTGGNLLVDFHCDFSKSSDCRLLTNVPTSKRGDALWDPLATATRKLKEQKVSSSYMSSVTRLRRTVHAASQRKPINDDDPFYHLFDITVMSPVLFGYFVVVTAIAIFF